MKNLTSTEKDLILNHNVYNSLRMVFPDGSVEPIENENIVGESMQLTQAICDEASLRFGGVIASELQISIHNTSGEGDTPSWIRKFDDSLEGKWFYLEMIHHCASVGTLFPHNDLYPSVDLYPNSEPVEIPVVLFSGCISSIQKDKNDPNVFNIVAYDLFDSLNQKNAQNWINSSIYYNSSSHNEFRVQYIFDHLAGMYNIDDYDHQPIFKVYSGISGRTYGTFNLYHADMNTDISYGNMLKYACEIAGVFAVVEPTTELVNGMLGRIKLIVLGKGEWKSGQSYPLDVREDYDYYESFWQNEIHEHYTAATYKREVNKQDEQDNDDIKCILDINNVAYMYDLTSNPFPYATSTSGYPFNSYIAYRGGTEHPVSRLTQEVIPIEAELIGKSWVEVGDKIRIKYNEIYPNGEIISENNWCTSYVLKRVLKGCNALTDSITVNGGSQTLVDDIERT